MFSFFARNKLLFRLLASLGLSLGIPAVVGVTTLAELPENLERVALEQVNKLSNVPLNQLTVVNASTVNYKLQGKTVFNFKVIDSSGKIYGITLNSSGQELSSAQLRASEVAAAAAQYGKLAPSVAQKLGSASQSQPMRVMIWLKQPFGAFASRPAANPHSTSGASIAQLSALLSQLDAQRSVAVQSIIAPIANWVKGFDSYLKTEKYSPVIYANLTPQAIRLLGAMSEVDQVYEARQLKPVLNLAGRTIHANMMPRLGITGAGVQVGEVEVGGRIATNNPFLAGVTQDTTYSCFTADDPDHSTGVAGILRSTHPTFRGIAPGVSLWVGGSCRGADRELTNRSTAAADWGAKILNLSLGGDSGRLVDGFAKFYDDMVFNRARTVVVAAGNEGEGNGHVLTPGVAYNVITVGSFDDRGTPNWTDDKISEFSSSVSPISIHGDRIKPEVAAPGENILSTTTSSPWTGSIGSGTSFASPMVAGVAALLIQRNSSLANWPEAVKAILMTSAVHNIYGDPRLSRYDGAGGIVADSADQIATNGTWGGQSYSCSAAPSLDVATIPLTAGVRTRSAIVWDQNPSYWGYSLQPSADLDLQIVDSSGSVVAGSYSYDNTYEMVDFTPSSSGNYKLRVKKQRCDLSPGHLGWAWRQGD